VPAHALRETATSGVCVSCNCVTARCDHRPCLLVTTQAPVASPSDQSPSDVVQFNLKSVLAGLSKTDAPRQGSSFVTQTPSCRAAQRTLDGLWVWPAKEGHPLVPPKKALVKISSKAWRGGPDATPPGHKTPHPCHYGGPRTGCEVGKVCLGFVTAVQTLTHALKVKCTLCTKYTTWQFSNIYHYRHSGNSPGWWVVSVVNPDCTDCRTKRRVARGVKTMAKRTGRDEHARAYADDRGHRNDTVPSLPQSDGVLPLPTLLSLPPVDKPGVDAMLAKIMQHCHTLAAHGCVAKLEIILRHLEGRDKES
jgi:hypothetical protein